MPTVSVYLKEGELKTLHAELEAAANSPLNSVLRELGFKVPCGGLGSCGKCRVKLSNADWPITPSDKNHISEAELTEGIRLACKINVSQDIDITLNSSQLTRNDTILTSSLDGSVELLPRTRALTLNQNLDFSNFTSLAEGLKIPRLTGSAEQLEQLTELKENNSTATLIVRNDFLLDIPPSTSPKIKPLGIAIDLGTTTIAATLYDLTSGAQLFVASTTNPQGAYGDDVISRIDYSEKSDETRREISDCVIDAFNTLIRECTDAAQVANTDIYDISIAGNTVMVHLLLGLPAGSLAIYPFKTDKLGPFDISSTELKINANANARVWIAPGLSAYLGGDILIGAALLKLHETKQVTLFVDIGTNGEVMLCDGTQILTTATAAGPAFEGARIQSGMRATPGAISAAYLKDNELQLRTIGDAPPVGICGSGLLDLVAVILKAGVIDATGRMVEGIDSPIGRRVQSLDSGRALLLFEQDGQNIYLTQNDIREFQLAKGAIAAGAKALMQRLGITPDNIERVLLAGAFGSHLSASSALSVGLLPSVPLDIVQSCGNTALLGASGAMLNQTLTEASSALANRAKHIELGADMDFQENFAECMGFEGSEEN